MMFVILLWRKIDSSTSCPKVLTTQFNKLNKLADVAGSDVFFSVCNWGMHCNDKDAECMRKHMEGQLKPYVSSPQYKHWTFLFRELQSQHFATKWSVYSGKKGTSTCADARGEVCNWRNEAAVDVLTEHNLTNRVPIVSIFDALEPLWQLHHVGDCTHYCYDPFRFEVTWDGILSSLVSFEEDMIV